MTTGIKSEKLRDSGLGWVGQVPIHWAIVPTRAVLKLQRELVGDSWVDRQLLSLTKRGIVARDIDSGHGKYPSSFDTYQVVRSGTLVFCLFDVDETPRTVGLSGLDGMVTGAYDCFITSSNLNERFAMWYYIAIDDGKRFRPLYSGLRKVIPKPRFLSAGFALPPLDEQRQIAEYLDRETGKIDELITTQEQLVATLTERRQVVIAQAVTRGLDSKVRMIDSGVEWIGEMPAHWSLKQLKRLSQVKRGASPRPIDDPKFFDEDGEWAWVRIADASSSNGHLKETSQTLSALGSSLSVRLAPGSLFVSIAGTVGKPCITLIRACIHDGFVYFPELNFSKDLLFRIFEAGRCYAGLGKLGTQLNLNTDTIGSIQIPVPPAIEQDAIVEYLHDQTLRIDTLVYKSQLVAETLRERRAALISAAVTGKIDVRGL